MNQDKYYLISFGENHQEEKQKLIDNIEQYQYQYRYKQLCKHLSYVLTTRSSTTISLSSNELPNISNLHQHSSINNTIYSHRFGRLVQFGNLEQAQLQKHYDYVKYLIELAEKDEPQLQSVTTSPHSSLLKYSNNEEMDYLEQNLFVRSQILMAKLLIDDNDHKSSFWIKFLKKILHNQQQPHGQTSRSSTSSTLNNNNNRKRHLALSDDYENVAAIDKIHQSNNEQQRFVPTNRTKRRTMFNHFDETMIS